MQKGDTVRWTSTACGVTKTKQGKILAVVPARTTPDAYGLTKKFNAKRGFIPGTKLRPEKSFVVGVYPAEDAKPSAKVVLYWPHTEKLENVSRVGGPTTGTKGALKGQKAKLKAVKVSAAKAAKAA